MSVTLKEVIDILGAEVILNKDDEDVYVTMACGSDLMSDVLSFIKPGALLLTGLMTVQVVYTAEMADIKIVCFVRGKKPQEETVELAESKNLILLRTKLPMFESCGRLYQKGLKGCSET
jgi:hypothetical protein